MSTGTTREVRLIATARAAGDARVFVRRVLGEFGCPKFIADTELIVTELVTNSYSAAPDMPIIVAIWRVGPALILEVWDCSEKAPVYMEPDFMNEHGRGLHIVDALSLHREHAIFEGGKVVWVLLGMAVKEYLSWRCSADGTAVFTEGRRASGLGWPSVAAI